MPPLGRQMSDEQWRRVQNYLDTWAAQVQVEASEYPQESYELGYGQILSFLEMIGKPTVGTIATMAAPATQEAIGWLKRSAMHEVSDALGKYKSTIKEALLYGVGETVHPTQLASWLYRQTRDAERDWRLIAQTEMVRANAQGRLQASLNEGYDKVWIPPHAGSCEECKRLLENKVFSIEELQHASNYGKKARDWVAALPLHPRCRHSALPYEPAVFEAAQGQYAAVHAAGLTDDVLDEMFDTSGQLKAGYAKKVHAEHPDPYHHALSRAVRKVAGTPLTVAKGFFDNPQVSLDPLLWDDMRLKADVRDQIVRWWKGALGDDAETWSHLFIIGSATSYQWETGWRHPWLGAEQTPMAPDVDVHIVLDYPNLRDARPELATLSDPEMHAAMSAKVAEAKIDAEVAPGMRLDAFIRPEQTIDEFRLDVSLTGQGVWDVNADEWVQLPAPPINGDLSGTSLEGVGGSLAYQHAEWLSEAKDAAATLQILLDAYRRHPTMEALGTLQDQLTVYYDIRTKAFQTGGEGYQGRGNFIWQYLENFGPLAAIKDLLHSVGKTTWASDARQASVIVRKLLDEDDPERIGKAYSMLKDAPAGKGRAVWAYLQGDGLVKRMEDRRAAV